VNAPTWQNWRQIFFEQVMPAWLCDLPDEYFPRSDWIQCVFCWNDKVYFAGNALEADDMSLKDISDVG
jgi:hypothetical protein